VAEEVRIARDIAAASWLVAGRWAPALAVTDSAPRDVSAADTSSARHAAWRRADVEAGTCDIGQA
jgi:hypothetical protein